MTPKVFKDHILASLGTLIGTYTYSNGYVSPAVYVGKPPNEINVKGIEVIIPVLPRMPDNLITGDTVHRCEKWDISLCDHGGGASLYEAVDCITKYFPITYAGQYIQPNDVLRTLPMYNLIIWYSDSYSRRITL